MDNKALIESRWGRERSPDHVLLIGPDQAAADLVIGEGGQISAALLTEYIEKSTGMRLERSPTSGASRKEAMDSLKEAQKDGLPEDDFKRAEKDVQKNTDDNVSKINQALSSKEGDLRKV